MIKKTTNSLPPIDPTRLLRAAAFPHDVTSLNLLETHISWVVLTGKYAYKIKKPVRLPFVDYSTLELRKHFCELELELNQELAPDIYLDVVKITGPACAPSINGTGEIIEYAVRMNEFDQADILTHRLENGSVTAPEIDRLAKLLADFQSRIPKSAPNSSFGSPSLVLQEAEDNFSAFRSALDEEQANESVWHSLLSEQQRNQLNQLQDWMHAEFKRCENLLIQRHASGMIRRGHGDMHAGNIVLFKGQIEIFDRIEFNQDFQWTDCLNELAFAYMDLIHHGRSDLAHRLLSNYLEQTADYIGLGVFRFYLVYRSMVRAKVDWIRQQQTSGSLGDSPDAIFQTPFLQLALKLSERPDCFLDITHGLSGSGKSTAAMKCVETRGAVRLRSDVERDRVTQKHPEVEKYSAEMRSKVYDALLETAENALTAGFSVVVDATFLIRIEREKFGKLAKRAGACFGIIECSAPVIELERRICERHADASEATVAVLHDQIRDQEALTQEELGYTYAPDDFGPCNTK